MFISVGRSATKMMILFYDVMTMLLSVFRNCIAVLGQGRAAVRTVLLKQVYFTGLEAVGIIVTIAVIIGTVIVVQVVSLVGSNGSLTGKILVWMMLRELAPLLTALIIISRSGTAIAAELGTMKINGELDTLEMMGIPVDRYLILPRIIGVTTSSLILTVYFVLTAFLGGFLVASLGWHIPFDQFFQGILASLGLREIAALFAKSALFGLLISTVCCRYGLKVGRSATEVPQAATRAVMTSLFVVFMLNRLITFVVSLTAI